MMIKTKRGSSIKLTAIQRQIGDLYVAGMPARKIAKRVGYCHQRIYQIINEIGLNGIRLPSGRTEFLGINVTKQTMEKLKSKAKQTGQSVSRMVSDLLDAKFK